MSLGPLVRAAAAFYAAVVTTVGVALVGAAVKGRRQRAALDRYVRAEADGIDAELSELLDGGEQ